MRKFIDKITCGDCIELLGKVKEPFVDLIFYLAQQFYTISTGYFIELLGKVKEPFVDLIFADPPFNIGYQYDQYKDKLKRDKAKKK